MMFTEEHKKTIYETLEELDEKVQSAQKKYLAVLKQFEEKKRKTAHRDILEKITKL